MNGTLLSFVGRIDGPTILIIAVVIFFLFGASRIPKLMRSLGSGLNEFKKGVKESGEEEKDPTKP